MVVLCGGTRGWLPQLFPAKCVVPGTVVCMFVLVVAVGISWYLVFWGGRIAQVANVETKGDVWLAVRQCDAGNATNGVGFSYWKPCQGRALEQWSEFGFWRLASWRRRKERKESGEVPPIESAGG